VAIKYRFAEGRPNNASRRQERLRSPMPSELSQRSTCAQELISGGCLSATSMLITGDTRPPALAAELTQPLY
jgi:hypothetical protein